MNNGRGNHETEMETETLAEKQPRKPTKEGAMVTSLGCVVGHLGSVPFPILHSNYFHAFLH